jgi:hypothetical protein
MWAVRREVHGLFNIGEHDRTQNRDPVLLIALWAKGV